MRVRLYESKWIHRIKGDLVTDFYHAIKESDYEKVRETSTQILHRCINMLCTGDDEKDDEHIRNELDGLIAEFSTLDVSGYSPNNINELLMELYNICDEYSILLDVIQEPEDAELYADASGAGQEDGDETVEVGGDE